MFSGQLIKAIQVGGQVKRLLAISKNDTTIPAALQTDQVEFHCAGRGLQSLRTARFACLSAALAARDRPDLIITVHAHFAPWAAVLRRCFGIPYFVVAHGIEVWTLSDRRIASAVLRANRVLPVSRFTRNRLLAQLALDTQKLEILPNTVDPLQFQIGPKPEYLLARHRLGRHQPLILTIARLAERERQKGYDRILRALPAIRQTIPDVHYIIGGQGPDRARVESLIADLHLQDCVTLAGFIPDSELCHYYQLADVFAMPSKGEGFGIVYLEAMACGKPVLAGNKDGAVDALQDGELGALVDPDDIQEIGKTLIAILQKTYPNPLIYQPEALRSVMLESFGPDQFGKRVTEFLKDHTTSVNVPDPAGVDR